MNKETKLGLFLGLVLILAFVYLVGKQTSQPVYFPTASEENAP